jgi:hypothetical protein
MGGARITPYRGRSGFGKPLALPSLALFSPLRSRNLALVASLGLQNITKLVCPFHVFNVTGYIMEVCAMHHYNPIQPSRLDTLSRLQTFMKVETNLMVHILVGVDYLLC